MPSLVLRGVQKQHQQGIVGSGNKTALWPLIAPSPTYVVSQHCPSPRLEPPTGEMEPHMLFRCYCNTQKENKSNNHKPEPYIYTYLYFHRNLLYCYEILLLVDLASRFTRTSLIVSFLFVKTFPLWSITKLMPTSPILGANKHQEDEFKGRINIFDMCRVLRCPCIYV